MDENTEIVETVVKSGVNKRVIIGFAVGAVAAGAVVVALKFRKDAKTEETLETSEN